MSKWSLGRATVRWPFLKYLSVVSAVVYKHQLMAPVFAAHVQSCSLRVWACLCVWVFVFAAGFGSNSVEATARPRTLSQDGVVASVYWLGRKDPVDELFGYAFFEPDCTEEGGHCRRDCLKIKESRLGYYRSVKELPFLTTEDDDEDDPPKPFVLKGRVVAHPKVEDAWVCGYFKQHAGLDQGQQQSSSPAAIAGPGASVDVWRDRWADLCQDYVRHLERQPSPFLRELMAQGVDDHLIDARLAARMMRRHIREGGASLTGRQREALRSFLVGHHCVASPADDLESLWRGMVVMERQLGMPLHTTAGLWEFASRCPRPAPAATSTPAAKRHRAK